MPDLLIELFSDEIPARLQARASDDLKRLVTNALVEAGLTYEGAGAYATPRRLTLTVRGLPAHQPDRVEERKGPRVGAPEGAIQGFLKAAGLSSIEEAKVQSDGRGEFYIASTRKPGRAAIDVIAEIVPQVVRGFPWPNPMRWGTGTLRWVRPLHSIMCLFGPETEEPDIVPFEIEGIVSGDTTRGHRFMAPDSFRVKHFDDYVAGLERARVVLDPARRRDLILNEARNLAFAQGFDLVEDESVLDEVTGLVEWPVVLMGTFDEAFLDVPPEAIQATIRANQKCFVLRNPRSGGLANRFVLVANIEAKDGGKAIVAGNERVIRARLSDARFFWTTDQAPLPGYETEGKPLDQRLAKIRASGVVFHQKLGTQGERIARIEALAREIAPLVGADLALTSRAALLAKADLVTEMVGEFPELQGLMGRYYATAQGEEPAVAAAIEEHYRPRSAGDGVPNAPVSLAVGLAERLDILTSFWSIGEKPTGNKDPYALRRSALGLIRIILDNDLRLALAPLISAHGERLAAIPGTAKVDAEDLIGFLADRLKVQLRDQGARHDLVDAVFALGGQDDFLLVVRRIDALGRFLDSEQGKTLLAGVKRAGNIIRIEEKKDGTGAYAGAVDAALLQEPEEKALAEALAAASQRVTSTVAKEDYAGAMAALAELQQPVYSFFDKVMVNAPEPDLRLNRLRLLERIREATRTVADFSRIEGV